MDYMTYRGIDYLHLDSTARALGVTTTTIRNWQRAGHINFERPLGPALTFVKRETVERLLKLRITAAMGAFIKETTP